MTTSIRARLRERSYQITKYPRCWKRASAVIRRLANGHCERCSQECQNLEVHHIGAPYIEGRPGSPRDKHDIRRENLAAICFTCHDQLEHVGAIRRRMRTRRKNKRAKREAHRALGIGTGLVVSEGAAA
jgi:HNH endonuclease